MESFIIYGVFLFGMGTAITYLSYSDYKDYPDSEKLRTTVEQISAITTFIGGILFALGSFTLPIAIGVWLVSVYSFYVFLNVFIEL